jgi:hypothetical protein
LHVREPVTDKADQHGEREAVHGPDWPATSPLRQVQHFECASLLRAEGWLLRGRRHPWPFKVGLDVATISQSFRRSEQGSRRCCAATSQHAPPRPIDCRQPTRAPSPPSSSWMIRIRLHDWPAPLHRRGLFVRCATPASTSSARLCDHRPSFGCFLTISDSLPARPPATSSGCRTINTGAISPRSRVGDDFAHPISAQRRRVR